MSLVTVVFGVED